MTENVYNPVKKSRLPIIIIAVAIVAVAAVVAVAVSGGFSSSQIPIETNGPLGLVAEGMVNSAEVQQEASEKSLFYKVSNGGSIEFVLEDSDILAELLGTEIPESAIFAKLYTDIEDVKFGIEAGLEIADIAVVDALLALDEKALTVASESMLGTKVLGIGFENIVENFDKSVFGPEGAYSLDISAAELFAELENELGINDLAALEDKYADFAAKTEAVVIDFCNMLVASLEENALIEEGESTIEFGVDFHEVKSVSILLDKVGLPAVVEDVCTYCRDNEEFRSYLAELFAIYEEMGMLEQLELGSTADEAMQNFDANINATLADLEGLAEEMGDGYLDFVFYINEEGNYLVGMDIILNDEGTDYKLHFFAGPNPAAPEDIRIMLSEGNDVLAEFIIKITNNKNSYEYELILEESDEESIYLELDYNKKDGLYELVMELYEEEYFTVSGSVIEESKQTVISVKTVKYDAEIFDTDIKFIFKTDDELKIDEYTDILLLTEEEFDTLVGELTGSLMGLMLMLQ